MRFVLFKPKWQDKDPTVRRACVAAGDDRDLLQALPQLVREDPDAGVRLAALKRLNDYEYWRERSTADPDASLRETARGTYVALLCAATSQPPLARRIAELETLNADELERVAAGAIDRDLRAAALVYVNRPALLADRAVTDPDAKLRLAALERVSDANLLERIAEKARKSDKAVAKRARERVEALRISAGDAQAIAERARGICERAETLMRRPNDALDAELDALDHEWRALGTTIPQELSARYQAARMLARRAAERLQNPPPPVAPEQTVTQETQADERARAPVSTGSSEEIESRARFDAALAAASAEARAERERRKHLQREIEQRLLELATAIDAGNAGDAHRLYAQIEAELKTLGETPAALLRELSPLQTRYAELKRWQHWSNNQRRRVLCADIEALAGSGLHPDAVATRVREAREEWQRMNAAEGAGDEGEASSGIARRFHALCQHALRPTRGYFSKRKEVRKSHEEEIAGLLARVAEIPDDSVEWKTIADLRAATSAALRDLDSVPPQSRHALAKQLKDAIARLTALAEAHEREIEQAKQHLIRQAAALNERSDRAGAAREARELQKKWSALGNGRRGADQRQWREFRTACDAVFGQLDAARREREQKLTEERAQAHTLVDEFEALAAAERPADETKAALRELDGRWQNVATQDRDLSRRQREARDAIARRLREAERQQRLARYAHALQKYSFVRELEAGVAHGADEWSTLPAASGFDGILAARHAAACAARPAPEDADAARDLLVQLEAAAGVESPGEDRERRMRQQVTRLSSRLRHGGASTPEQELEALLSAWFAQAPQSEALEQRFARAARAAVDSLP